MEEVVNQMEGLMCSFQAEKDASNKSKNPEGEYFNGYQVAKSLG